MLIYHKIWNEHNPEDKIEYGDEDKYCIHHIDGNHYNNDISNLRKMLRGAHTSLHHTDKLLILLERREKESRMPEGKNYPENSNSFRCKGCQKFFTSLTRKTKYCSVECKRKHYSNRDKDKRKNKKKKELITKELTKECKKCGVVFQTNLKVKKFCSIECKNVFHKSGIIKIKKCKCCHKDFECTNNSKLYCSNRCYLKAKKIRDKIYYKRST